MLSRYPLGNGYFLCPGRDDTKSTWGFNYEQAFNLVKRYGRRNENGIRRFVEDGFADVR